MLDKLTNVSPFYVGWVYLVKYDCRFDDVADDGMGGLKAEVDSDYSPVLGMSPVSFAEGNVSDVVNTIINKLDSEEKRLRRRPDGELFSDDFYECQDESKDGSIDWIDEISSSQGSNITQSGEGCDNESTRYVFLYQLYFTLK